MLTIVRDHASSMDLALVVGWRQDHVLRAEGSDKASATVEDSTGAGRYQTLKSLLRSVSSQPHFPWHGADSLKMAERTASNGTRNKSSRSPSSTTLLSSSALPSRSGTTRSTPSPTPRTSPLDSATSKHSSTTCSPSLPRPRTVHC